VFKQALEKKVKTKEKKKTDEKDQKTTMKKAN